MKLGGTGLQSFRRKGRFVRTGSRTGQKFKRRELISRRGRGGKRTGLRGLFRTCRRAKSTQGMKRLLISGQKGDVL
jgi:hypothetical protein